MGQLNHYFIRITTFSSAMAGADNLKKPQNAIKLLEFLLAFVIVCFTFAPSCAGPSGIAFANNVEGLNFNHFVIIGYFFIITVQILSIFVDKNEVPAMNTLFALCGAIFYLSAGSLVIDYWKDAPKDFLGEKYPCRANGLTLGSLMLFQAILMLLETALHAKDIKKQ